MQGMQGMLITKLAEVMVGEGDPKGDNDNLKV